MKLPKRFRLHEAAGSEGATGDYVEAIRADGDRLISVDTASFSVVPILASDERPGVDLPRLAAGEGRPDALIAPKAIAEATRGTKGEGRLQIGPESTEVTGGDGKPWVRFDNPVGSFPPIDDVLELTRRPAPSGHRHVEICLDAEALARVARAIGAREAVRLRFLINETTGRCDASGEAHGAIEVRPVREPDAGSGVLMAVIVS